MQTRAFIVLSARECSTYVGDLELVNLLQMLSEDLDELMRRYVFHSVYVFVDQRKVLLHAIDMVKRCLIVTYLHFSSSMRLLLNNSGMLQAAPHSAPKPDTLFKP